MMDIQHRKVWSLSTGKLIDECDIDDVPDDELHLRMPEQDNIRVEVTLRNAIEMFERKRARCMRDFLATPNLPRGGQKEPRWN